MFGKGKKKYKDLADSELIDIYKRDGDKNCIAELFERYTHLVFAVCMKYLKNQENSRDASMQIFEKLFVDIQKHEINYFKGWLHMVCRNFCLMQLRSAKSKPQSKEIEESDTKVVQMESQAHLIDKEEKEEQLNQLEICVSKLKDEQKTCVEMFFLQEMCYQQIAEKTGFELKKVKSYIQNGKRNLRICMESSHGEG